MSENSTVKINPARKRVTVTFTCRDTWITEIGVQVAAQRFVEREALQDSSVESVEITDAEQTVTLTLAEYEALAGSPLAAAASAE